MIVVRPKESVIERWERLSVTGSRIIRSCTEEAKIEPIAHFTGPKAEVIIGFSMEESHRANKRKRSKKEDRILRYPLIEKEIDREDCKQIIEEAHLCLPIKSGCWCCPNLRVGEILDLVKKYPERAQRIERLERAAIEKHGDNGERHQFHDRPMSYWFKRAANEEAQLIMFSALEETAPCECWL